MGYITIIACPQNVAGYESQANVARNLANLAGLLDTYKVRLCMHVDRQSGGTVQPQATYVNLVEKMISPLQTYGMATRSRLPVVAEVENDLDVQYLRRLLDPRLDFLVINSVAAERQDLDLSHLRDFNLLFSGSNGNAVHMLESLERVLQQHQQARAKLSSQEQETNYKPELVYVIGRDAIPNQQAESPIEEDPQTHERIVNELPNRNSADYPFSVFYGPIQEKDFYRVHGLLKGLRDPSHGVYDGLVIEDDMRGIISVIGKLLFIRSSFASPDTIVAHSSILDRIRIQYPKPKKTTFDGSNASDR